MKLTTKQNDDLAVRRGKDKEGQFVEIKPGDVCISSERCRNGWEDRLSLTRDAALRLIKEASDKADPSAQARINKGLTNAQAFQILGGGVLRDPVGYLFSRNILKQCGIPLNQMQLNAPTEAQKEQPNGSRTKSQRTAKALRQNENPDFG